MANDFKVKVGEFEGPIDLLLHLIEKEELDINAVSLAKVADTYIEYLNSQEELPVSETANFLVIASTLLLIKSISLLPNLPVTAEEQASIEELEARLRIYKLLREKSVLVGERFGEKIIFERSSSIKETGVFAPADDLDTGTLRSAIFALLKELPQLSEVPKAVVRKIISLDEVIRTLMQRIESNIRTSFNDFAGRGKGEKVNIIVTFLAVLELVRRGIVSGEQKEHFSDFEIESTQL